MSIRDLQRNPSAVVGTVQRSGRPAIVTRNGKPVAAIMAVDEEALEDFVLANAPAFVKSMREADAELARGETTTLADHLSASATPPVKARPVHKAARARRTA